MDRDITKYSAKDVMRTPVIIDPHRTVAHAKLLMERSKTACLCVSGGGRIDGLLRKSEINSEDEKETVGEVMEPCRMSVVARSDLSFVMKLIQQENLHSVLVMESGKCVGIITRETLSEDGFMQ